MRGRNAVITVVMAMVLATSILSAQEGTGTEKKQTAARIGTKEFKDLNANGVDDAKENLRPAGGRSAGVQDRFIDTNGDGICDNREQGLGFRRGVNSTGKLQSGKRQQGRQK